MPTYRILLFVLLLVPLVCPAQPRWRVEVSGGIFAPQVIGGSKDVPFNVVNGQFVAHSVVEIPSEVPVVKPIGGLRFMRQDSNFEYGLSVQVHTIKFNAQKSYVAVDQHTYLARPAIPVTAFFNYGHHWRKFYAFAGLSGGVMFARGREMQDANTLFIYQDFDIYMHNSTGYVVGGQLGFRRSYGKIDLGMELAINFAHLPMTQGTSNTPLVYDILYFPVKGYLGYSF